jgi:hypothetical protein
MRKKLVPLTAAAVIVSVAIAGGYRSHAAEAAERDVPVHVGGAIDLDACPGSGAVTGLDPKGDNFLSVRSGPGGRGFRERDRVHTGQRLTICEEQGVWLGVVYSPDPAVDCGLATPRPKVTAYKGPCRSGWVHGRYVGDRAG